MNQTWRRKISRELVHWGRRETILTIQREKTRRNESFYYAMKGRFSANKDVTWRLRKGRKKFTARSQSKGEKQSTNLEYTV